MFAELKENEKLAHHSVQEIASPSFVNNVLLYLFQQLHKKMEVN